jgi:hypothetical protein
MSGILSQVNHPRHLVLLCRGPARGDRWRVRLAGDGQSGSEGSWVG